MAGGHEKQSNVPRKTKDGKRSRQSAGEHLQTWGALGQGRQLPGGQRCALLACDWPVAGCQRPSSGHAGGQGRRR